MHLSVQKLKKLPIRNWGTFVWNGKPEQRL